VDNDRLRAQRLFALQPLLVPQPFLDEHLPVTPMTSISDDTPTPTAVADRPPQTPTRQSLM
jgi:hypothetical protein